MITGIFSGFGVSPSVEIDERRASGRGLDANAVAAMA
jgi:hypothetical protein